MDYTTVRSSSAGYNIIVVPLWFLIEQNFPEFRDFRRSYDEECAAIDKWCEENDAFLYERGRETFLVQEGVELAAQAGKSKVVVNDLS